MKKPDWAKLHSNIPNKLRTKARTHFDVLWQDNLHDRSGAKCYGITEFNPNQIKVCTAMSEKEAVLTVWHEYLHAMSDSYEVTLTESEVRKLEKSFLYFREFFLSLEKK